jgi:succinoglycan biosynthesis transport protein ExoP
MQENDSLKNIDLKYYRGLIYRKRYLALGIALAVLSAFTWGSFLVSKTYETSATVYIQGSSLINPLIQGVGVTVSLEERLRNLRNILTSRSLLERVIKKLNLDANIKNPTQFEALVEDLKKSLTVTVRSGGASASDLYFTIAYRGGTPKQVTDLVTTHISECIAISENSRTQDVYGAFSFIEKELNDYRAKLDASDNLIRSFREQHPQMVPQSESAVASRIEGFQSGRIDAEIKLRELEKRRESIKKQLSGEKELTIAFVTREGSPQARLSQLNNQLLVLTTKYTDDYPEVIKVKDEIQELQKQIASAAVQQKHENSGSIGAETSALNPVYQQLKEELGKTDTEIETLRARQGELVKQTQEGQTILRSMPKEQEEWSKLQRDRNVYQRIYDDLMIKLESARVSRDLELGSNTTFKIMDPPIVPNLPISPNRIKLILMGLFLGIASGIGTVVGLDYMDPSFKSEDRVETGLKVPLLASVPQIVTEEDRLAVMQLDKKYYKAAVIYLGIVGLVLVEAMLSQILGINIIKL